ncbi:MAG TPA: carboxypeptidase regulatory-like domain-containing protein [Planctomycetes bacterium]|nr:carboxypeptidase regulatory-like domain-containing protein [Planctomycetota bacterium]HIK59425.1 carboxypeptidase regulatory-like domain-containing protein [Planctomycetota bacterium]
MIPLRQRTLLILLFVALATGGVVIQAVLQPDLAPQEPGDLRGAQKPDPAIAGPSEPLSPLMQAPEEVRDVGAQGTTVIHPLKVELTLLKQGSIDALGGIQPVGSGASARIKGNLLGSRGEPEVGTVTFTAGANRGRVLETDSTGHFGASDLYQGLSIVLVESARGIRSEREVMLRQLATSSLVVSLGRGEACVVRGFVRDRAGEPIGQAKVRMDAQEAFSDDLGEFFFPRISPGKILVVVTKEGRASYREKLNIPRNGAIKRDKLTFTLDEGVSLTLSVEGLVGSNAPSQAYLFPIGVQRVNAIRGQRTYPWHLVNPIEIQPGRSVQVDGLPPGHVSLMIFHPGATGSPALVNKKLFAGRSNHHGFVLKKAPSLRGQVTMSDGSPAARATVGLDAPDVGLATTKVMQQKFTHNLSMVLPPLPAGRQRMECDENGRFTLTLHPTISKGYYLSALSADGTQEARRSVRAESGEADLVLKEIRRASGSLEIGLAGRFQGLPVKVTIKGKPGEVTMLDPADALVIDGLEPGVWRAEIWWNYDCLERARQIEVEPDGRTSLGVVLPIGALEGQSAEERSRSGLSGPGGGSTPPDGR